MIPSPAIDRAAAASSPRPARWTRSHLLVLVAGLLLTACVSRFVIQDYSQPIAGAGDHNIWEYQGYFFKRNFTLLPWPALNLTNNDNCYPVGIDHPLSQSWAFEQHFWYAGLYAAFGPGPWLQPYLILSLLVTAVGAFLLLRGDFGFGRAAAAGLGLGFGNFYAFFKYPEHYTFAVVHWVVLGIMCDFVLIKRLVRREPVTARLLVGRIMLLLLSLGLDLGYTFGYGLVVLTLTVVWIVFLLLERNRWTWRGAAGDATGLVRGAWREARGREMGMVGGMTTVIAVTAFLYVPLAAQIALALRKFDFSGMALYGSWVNPLRLLIPYLPGIDHGRPLWTQWLLDAPETLADARPGMALVIVAGFSLFAARRSWRVWAPFVAALLLCLFFHPRYFPTLRIFPWFQFNRGAGRASSIYPALLCILCLLPPAAAGVSTWRRGTLLAVGLLALVEFSVVFGLKAKVTPYVFAPSFGPAMERIRASEGSALFEWPFSISSGNGEGFAQGFSPYVQLGFDHTFARFHQKKTMGYYLARMHPSQLKPFLDVGWDLLFLPNSQSPWRATRQARDFRPAEWTFLKQYYESHDFCGALIYTDFLPPEVIARFRAEFGVERAATEVPGAGHVIYLERTVASRAQRASVDVPAAFAANLERAGADLLREAQPAGIRGLTGVAAAMGDIETDADTRAFRWMSGPAAILQLHVPSAGSWRLEAAWESPLPAQAVTLRVNGAQAATSPAAPRGQPLRLAVTLPLRAGWNECRFDFATWNQKEFGDRLRWKLLRRRGPTIAFPNDSRPLAAKCLRFTLEPAD